MTVQDLQSLSKLNGGSGNRKPVDGPDGQDESADLEILLRQTKGMNALESAKMFQVHKKDINDRMNSLAFKMEKVYNLDKKKGPASDVYRYFRGKIEQDKMIRVYDFMQKRA